MTTKELQSHIGQSVNWRPGKFTLLTIEMMVLDARSQFGRVDILISPVAGSGQQWVDVQSCSPVKPLTPQTT